MSSPAAPPPPPDPTKTAAAQANLNKQTATTQYGLNATNQQTPYGSLTYQQVGTWPDGTPRFQATTSLSPEQQQLYNQYTKLAGQYGGIANNELGAVGNMLSTPFNVDQATADKLVGMQKEFLDPQWSTYAEQNASKLANQGIVPGSDAYETAMRDFNTSRNNAYDQMYLNAYNQAQQSALLQRQEPLNELSTLLGGAKSGETNPNFVNTPQTNLPTPDLAGMTYQSYQMGPLAQYQAQNNYTNAMMGGLFGLGGSVLGAGGRVLGAGGFGNPFGVPVSGQYSTAV